MFSKYTSSILLLTSLFIGLKISNLVTWDWITILSPIWVSIIVLDILPVIALVASAIHNEE